jgi:hypothetical protein
MELSKYYNYGSDKVDTYINHIKMRHITRLAIIYPINVPPSSSLEKEVLSDHQQPVASSNQLQSLLLRKEVRP